jgi:hypothetical protein
MSYRIIKHYFSCPLFRIVELNRYAEKAHPSKNLYSDNFFLHIAVFPAVQYL